MPVTAEWLAATTALCRARMLAGALEAPTNADVADYAGHASSGSSGRPNDEHLSAVAASVFRQEYTVFVRDAMPHHRAPPQRRRYAAQYAAGESIVTIATRARCSPYLMARLLLEELCGARGDRREVTLLLRNLDMLPDAALRRHVDESLAADVFFGPRVDRIRAAVGAAHERLLCDALRSRGVPFVAEEGLRELGAAKTPDVRLDVPIGLLDAAGRPRIVHWIDSKATFGDPESHAANLKQACAVRQRAVCEPPWGRRPRSLRVPRAYFISSAWR